MGAPQSIGSDAARDSLIPVELQKLIWDASAGSDYTLEIQNDRSVAAGGYIKDLSKYKGQFGIKSQNLQEGLNDFPIIETVLVGGNQKEAPDFAQVFAGVEVVPGGEEMHSVFIDVEGKAYASGNNEKVRCFVV